MQLDDFAALRKNPLLSLSFPENEAGGVVALQQRLLSAIESIKDDPAVGASEYYDVLYYRYVEQLRQDEVAFQLGTSVRQLRRIQNNAIALLADRLWKEVAPASDEPPMRQANPQTEPPPGDVHDEIAWLSREFRAEASVLATELQKALAEADVLAQHYGVTVAFSGAIEPHQVSVPPLVLRQALLNVLAAMIVNHPGGRVEVTWAIAARELLVSVRAQKPSAEEQPMGVAIQTTADLLAPFNGKVRLAPDGAGVAVYVPTVASIPVLVVDDNPDARQLFQRYAANTRFRIIATGDAKQAIALAENCRPQALVLDVMMPEIDGWDLLAKWRHHPATHQIPVAICTILPQQELAHLLGAAHFVQKPVDQESFLEALESLTA